MSGNELIFNLIYVFICPLVMLIMGIRYRVKPPEYPKGAATAMSGYRSSMSKCNEDTWKTAHSSMGLSWFVLGILTLVITFLSLNWMMAQENFEMTVVILVFLQLFLMIAPPVIITEIRLRMLFNRNGERKEKR